MAFQIKLTAQARRDVREVLSYLDSASPEVAQRWYRKFGTLQKSLKRMPARFAVIPEAEVLGESYRDALVYSHRVIYRIDEESSTVYIVRIYHGARRPLVRGDIQ